MFAQVSAIDAHLVSGGLPGILRAWPAAMPPSVFLERECADPASAVFSVPGASLLAEFPQPDQARRVLEAVGADRSPTAGRIYFTGSIKWLRTPFDTSPRPRGGLLREYHHVA
jgi:hypothetical protein